MARVEFVIETDGRVGAVRVLESPPHADLEVAAVASVRRWRFRPARKNGTPVRQVAVGEVMFRLK
jgi:protein TonB